jgi:hypothetical protein
MCLTKKCHLDRELRSFPQSFLATKQVHCQYTTTPLHGHHRGTLYCCCKGNDHILVTTKGGGGGGGYACCSFAACSKQPIHC